MDQGPHVASYGVCGSTFTPHRKGLVTPKAAFSLPHQKKVVCVAVPAALMLHCVFCCAVSPDCPPYSTAPSPRTDHHHATRLASNSGQPWTTLNWAAHNSTHSRVHENWEDEVQTPPGHMPIMSLYVLTTYLCL